MEAVILGTAYKVEKKKYSEEPYFEENNVCGYCDAIEKSIVYIDMQTWPGWEKEPEKKCIAAEKETLRHEVIHAFLNESGLCENSGIIGIGWAKNEEMVDWIALQFPKILAVYRQLDAV